MKKRKIIKVIIIPVIMIIILILIIILTIINCYSLDNTLSFNSPIYQIETNYIKNISPNTTIPLYNKYFDLENCHLKIIDKNNKEITSGYIFNGSKTIVYDNNNNIINTYTNIITGDINSDGLVDSKDIKELANYLILRNNQEEYTLQSMDINNNGEIKVSDLVKLKDTLNNGYQNLTLSKDEINLMTNETERLIAITEPNQLLNQNHTWTSSNTSVATIDESGTITPHQEGTTTITATTSDGKLSKTVKIIIDNTIKLSENTKTAYIGGENINISIKSITYDKLTCNSTNESVATCEIKDKELIITQISPGTTTITVASPTYGSTPLELTVIDPYFTIFPKSACMPVNKTGKGIISSFNIGKIEVTEITDSEIIQNAYIGTDGYYITSGSKTGDAQVTFKESNGNKTTTFTANVYKLNIPAIGGIGYANGEDFSSKIIAENTGNLSCASPDNSIATCKIVDDNIVVTPLSPGEVYLEVKGSKCGTTKYLAVIKSEVVE